MDNEIWLIRQQFPWFFYNQNTVYFDSAATILKPEIVIQALNYNQKLQTQQISEVILKTAQILGQFLNCNYNQIGFTSGATFSANALAVVFEKIITSESEIILNFHEHAANLLPWENLAQKKGAKITFISDTDFNTSSILSMVSTKTKLVAFANATNLSGVRIDANFLASAIKKVAPNCIVIVDATQFLQHEKMDLNNSEIDFLFGSAHKMYGPNGIGFLYLHSDWLCSDLKKSLNNWIAFPKFWQQNNNFSLDFHALFGFQAALIFFMTNYETILEREKMLCEYFKKKFPQNPQIVFLNKQGNSTIFLIRLQDISGEDLAYYLSQKHIITRAGLSCAKLAYKVFETKNMVRISLAFYNQVSEIDQLFDALKSFKISDLISNF